MNAIHGRKECYCLRESVIGTHYLQNYYYDVDVVGVGGARVKCTDSFCCQQNNQKPIEWSAHSVHCESSSSSLLAEIKKDNAEDLLHLLYITYI